MTHALQWTSTKALNRKWQSQSQSPGHRDSRMSGALSAATQAVGLTVSSLQVILSVASSAGRAEKCDGQWYFA